MMRMLRIASRPFDKVVTAVTLKRYGKSRREDQIEIDDHPRDVAGHRRAAAMHLLNHKYPKSSSKIQFTAFSNNPWLRLKVKKRPLASLLSPNPPPIPPANGVVANVTVKMGLAATALRLGMFGER